MADFTAKDVQALRQSTGAGMMDCKRALEETGGDMEAAAKLLRERGLAASAKRSDRENAEGAVALATADGKAAIVELKCETDFVAKSEDFKKLADSLAEAVLADGEDAAAGLQPRIDDLKVTLKENIELGRVARVEAPAGGHLGSYLHVQNDRGVNAVAVAIEGGSDEMARELSLHVAFARPSHLTRDEVPADEVEAERATLETITRNEGKPEQAIAKIVEGRLNGWYAERCLLDQKFVRDEKQTVAQYLGDAKVARFVQVEIGR